MFNFILGLMIGIFIGIMLMEFIKIVIFAFILLWILIDFYNDYQCSTTQDIKWYVDNNCIRYIDKRKK